MPILLALQVPADSPNWAEIVEALGTVVGAVATASTIIFLLFQLRDQQAQTRLQAEQARKGQAERIVVSMLREEETGSGVRFCFSIENRSGRPCYFTYFEVFDENEVAFFQYGTLDSTAATGTVELGPRFRSPTDGTGETGNHAWPFYRISFMDAANVFWVRDSLGVLEETRTGVPSSWPDGGTFAEKRAHQVVRATGRYANATPESVTPDDMWVRRGRAS